MANKVLGECACPLCGYPAQEVRETSKSNPKPYLCCEDCSAQIFSRGAKSARLLKNLIAASQKKESPATVAFEPVATEVKEVISPPDDPAPVPPPLKKDIFSFF